MYYYSAWETIFSSSSFDYFKDESNDGCWGLTAQQVTSIFFQFLLWLMSNNNCIRFVCFIANRHNTAESVFVSAQRRQININGNKNRFNVCLERANLVRLSLAALGACCFRKINLEWRNRLHVQLVFIHSFFIFDGIHFDFITHLLCAVFFVFRFIFSDLFHTIFWRIRVSLLACFVPCILASNRSDNGNQ